MILPHPARLRARPALRGLGLAVLAVALTTCRDNPNGPPRGGRGTLAVQPVLAGPADVQAFGLTIDSLRIVVVRPATDTVKDTTVFFDPDSSALHLALGIDLVAPAETLTVSLILSAGGVPLFSGSASAVVTAGAPPSGPPLSVPMSFTGPGSGVTHLSISPTDSAIREGDSLRFRVSADSLGVPVTSFYVAWSTGDTLRARINAFGVVRAPIRRDTVTIFARTFTGVKDSVRVTFAPAPALVTPAGGVGQSGTVLTALALPLRVRVMAGDLLGVKGVAVRFSPGVSGGAVADSVVATDDSGFAQTVATLGGTAGPQTFQASVTGFAPVLIGETALAGPIAATKSVVTVSSGSLASGAAATLTLQGKDAGGNNVSVGGATVVFAASGGGGVSAGSIGAVTDNGNGTYTASFTGVLAGTATTISATVNGVAVGTALPSISVVAGPISTATSIISVSSGTILSGVAATLTLRAKDAAGNNLTAGGAAVVFSDSGGTSTGTIGGTTDNGNGTYTAPFTGLLAGTATSIKATIGGVAVATARPTITVTPGLVSAATSLITVSPDTILSGAVSLLRLQAKDAAGNNLATGGASVLFSRSGGVSTGTISATADSGNGVYTATFLGGVAGSATTIGATVNGAAVGTGLPTIAVKPGVPSPSNSSLTVSSGTVASGASVTLTLTARDAAGNATPGATVVFSDSGGTSTGTIGSVVDQGNGTYTATFTAALAGTAVTIHATLNGAPVTTALPTITVVPGNAVTAQSIITVDSASLLSGHATVLKLQARDAQGNNITTGGLTVVFGASGGTSAGAITPSPATDNGNGTYTATFSATIAGTPTTIGATIGGQPVTSTLPTITVLPGVTATVTVLPALDTVHAVNDARVFAATAKDANGNVIGGKVFTWKSSDTLLVKVDSTGRAVALAGGLVTITATTDGVNGTATLVVAQVVKTVVVSPAVDTVFGIGLTRQFTATARDSNGVAIPGASFTWGSSATGIATINAAGLATAVAPGTTIITATSAGISGTATLVVTLTVHATDIIANETWFANQNPHLVSGNVRIRNGATLTIQAGALVKFDSLAALQVGDSALGQTGGLVLDGSLGAITLTANSPTPIRGFWRGVSVQKSLAVAPWRNVLLEWGATGGGACIQISDPTGAPLDLDSLRLRQCGGIGGLLLLNGVAHLHRSEVDSTGNSGVAAGRGTVEVDSTTFRGVGTGILFSDTIARLGPSAGNRFLGNTFSVRLTAFQLPGLLRQDSIAGNANDRIMLSGGRPDPAAPVVTLFRQPRGATGFDYEISTGAGLLDIGSPSGQALVLDSGLVVGFDVASGIVIGDSAGTRGGTLRSLATGAANAPQLIAATGAAPGLWVGVEIGRLSAPDTVGPLRIQYAGDSLPGRTVHRIGLWVRSPVPLPLVLDGPQIFQNGTTPAAANSGGLAVTAAGGGVEVRNGNIGGNPGYGLVVPDNAFRVTGTLFNGNRIGLAAFTQGGRQLTTADSIAGNTYTGNTYAVALTAASLRAFYDTLMPANLTDTLRIEGSFLTADARLPRVPGFVWHAAGPITVDSGATFTIVAGDTVTFDTLVSLSGPGIPAFLKGFPVGAAAITIGGLQPAALAAPGTAAAPILLTTSVPGRGWGGIEWAKPQGAGSVTNNVFTFVTVDRAGFFAPCFQDCLPTPFSALRVFDSTDVALTYDHVVVRGSGAYGLDFERMGTGTVTVSNSQFYNNAGAVRAQSGHGNQLTITGSDLYNYRGTVINATYQGIDSVNADNNWWGDVAGPNPGFTFADSLGRGSFAGTAVRVGIPANGPFFPVGPAARTIAARDTFLVSDTVLSTIGQSDSIRVRVVDAEGRGVPGSPVAWASTSGTSSPSGTSDLGGRVGSFWHTGPVAGLQTLTAAGPGAPVVFPLTLLPGHTDPATVSWQLDAAYTLGQVSAKAVTFSSTNRQARIIGGARDGHGNGTFPNEIGFADPGLPFTFSQYGVVDSLKGDSIYFHATTNLPPVFVLRGLYDSGLNGQDSVLITMAPAAVRVRIDRDVNTPGVVDTLPTPITFDALCRNGFPTGGPCQLGFQAFVVDSGNTPVGNGAAGFLWHSAPAPDTAITVTTRGAPANDTALVTAHDNGTTWLVAVDSANPASPTFGRRDSVPIVVQQRPSLLLITPPAASLRLGDSTVFTATVTDQGGDTMPASAVHWRVEAFTPGLKILDTSVVNKVKVRLDSGDFAQLTAVTCCSTAPAPFDTVFGLATVTNPAQVTLSPVTAPWGVSLNLVTHKAYIALDGADSVAVVDLNTDAVVGGIAVPQGTRITAVNQTTNRLYVASDVGGPGYVIDAGTGLVADSFDLGAGFTGQQIAVDEGRNRIYVPLVGRLAVLDGSTGARIDTVLTGGGFPGTGVAYNPTLDRIYVIAFTGGATDTVRVIDAATLQVVASVPVGANAHAVAVNPTTGKVYVSNQNDGSVTVINGGTNSVVATASVGVGVPVALAVDPVANLIYVTLSNETLLFVIDGATDNAVRTVDIGGASLGVAATPNRGPVVVTKFSQFEVRVLHF